MKRQKPEVATLDELYADDPISADRLLWGGAPADFTPGFLEKVRRL